MSHLTFAKDSESYWTEDEASYDKAVKSYRTPKNAELGQFVPAKNFFNRIIWGIEVWRTGSAGVPAWLKHYDRSNFLVAYDRDQGLQGGRRGRLRSQ